VGRYEIRNLLIIEFVELSVLSGFYIAGHPEVSSLNLKNILSFSRVFLEVVVFISLVAYVLLFKRV